MAASNVTSGRGDSKLSLYKNVNHLGGPKKRTDTKGSASSVAGGYKGKAIKKPSRSKLACSTPGPPMSTQGMVTSTPITSFVKTEPVSKTPSERSVAEKSISEGGGGQITDEMEMELLYARLFQMTYLDVMSAKALKKQESLAKAQLHWLWTEVERKKEEVAQLSEKLESETRKMELDKALQVQEDGLQPLCSQLPSVEKDYGKLMQALDSTRHNMKIEGTLPVQEDKLEDELTEVEQVLGEIKSLIRGNLSETSDLSSSMECFCKVLGEEHQELKSCDRDISSLLRAQVRRTSYEINKTTVDELQQQ